MRRAVRVWGFSTPRYQGRGRAFAATPSFNFHLEVFLLLILINKFFKQFGLPLTIFCLFAGVSDAPRRLKNPGESYAESTSAD